MTSRKLTALLAAPLAIAALAAPARADQAFEAGTYDEHFEFVSTSCDGHWDVDLRRWGRYQLRETEPGAPEVLVHDVGEIAFHAVDPDTGDSFWIRGRTNFKVRAVTDLGDGVWRLDLTSSGRTWVMTSESGQVVWADRGIFYETVTVDTQGDDDPENDTYASEYSWSGPHFFSDTAPGSQYCVYQAQAVSLG